MRPERMPPVDGVTPWRPEGEYWPAWAGRDLNPLEFWKPGASDPGAEVIHCTWERSAAAKSRLGYPLHRLRDCGEGARRKRFHPDLSENLLRSNLAEAAVRYDHCYAGQAGIDRHGCPRVANPQLILTCHAFQPAVVAHQRGRARDSNRFQNPRQAGPKLAAVGEASPFCVDATTLA